MTGPAASVPMIPPKEELVPVGFTLFVRQNEAIDRLAEESGRNKSDVVRMLLDRALGEAA